MKRFAVIFIIGLLLSGGQIMAAQVTSVELSYQEGAVVARVYVEGQIRFTHETEVPKDGRPDRVIVDVLSATHELGAREFLGLPACVIQSIRSSQYAVTPEKIVRVVFDLKKSPVYKVDVQNNAIVLCFTDKEARSFATWSSSGVVPSDQKTKTPVVAIAPPAPQAKPVATATSAAHKNKAIESDRQASLEGNTKAIKDTPVSKPVAKAQDKTTPAGFNQILAQTAPAPVAPKAEPPAPKAAPTVRKAEPVKEAPGSKPSDTKVEAKSDTKSAPVPPTRPAVTPKTSSPVKADKELAPAPLPKAASSKNLVTTGTSTPAPAAKPEIKSEAAGKTSPKKSTPEPKTPVTVAKSSPAAAPAVEAPEPKKTATSRFRRSAESNNIKGTLVAEFPQRLVVQYSSSEYRDPFKTLIDAARTQNVPVEQRIANVEGLKLVGIIESDGGSNRALFEDKEGYGYMLRSGDKVRNGYVLRVEADQVYFQIFEYGWSRTVALKME